MADSDPPPATVAKRKADTERSLMLPPPIPPKKIRRPAIVLDEDVYDEALSHIIARDYFPGLLQPDSERNAPDTGKVFDTEWTRDAEMFRRGMMTPDRLGQGSDTPTSVATTVTPGRMLRSQRGANTPARTPMTGTGGVSSSTQVVDTTLSLSEFQARYTSEDNASFNNLLDKQNAIRAKKNAHFRDHTNTIPSKRLLLARAREQGLIEGPPRPSQDLAARSAGFDSFPVHQGSRNALMFSPEGVESNSLAPPPSANPAATRMPDPATVRPPPPESPSLSAIDAAIAGNASSSGGETPRVGGWAFVDEEPTSAEVAAAEAAKYDFGDDDDGDAATEGKFRVAQPSARESLARRMANKNARRDREAAKRTRPDEKLGGMTPAAMSLAARLGATPARSSGGGAFDADKGNKKKAWTPLRTPIRRP